MRHDGQAEAQILPLKGGTGCFFQPICEKMCPIVSDALLRSGEVGGPGGGQKEGRPPPLNVGVLVAAGWTQQQQQFPCTPITADNKNGCKHNSMPRQELISPPSGLSLLPG